MGVVRTFPPLSFAVSQPLIKPQFASPPKRFRRDVLEGTLEEMLEPEIVEKNEEEDVIAERFRRSSNATESERAKRQADFPGVWRWTHGGRGFDSRQYEILQKKNYPFKHF